MEQQEIAIPPIEAPRVRIAKAIILGPKGRVLVLGRAATDTHRPGGVDFPGGSAEIDGDDMEEVPDAASREILEETGLVIPPGALVEVPLTMREPRNDGRIFERHLLVGRVTLAEAMGVKLNPEEHAKLNWVRPIWLRWKFRNTHWRPAIRMAIKQGFLKS